jgi:hypothetical protein
MQLGGFMTKRGRKPDTKIIYTPEQTRRYKSQLSRYEKGLELARGNSVHKVDDKTYRIESMRSPVGYWEVKIEEDIQGDSSWDFYYDNTQGSYGNSQHLVTTIGEETTRFTSSLTRNSSLKSGSTPGNYLFVATRNGTIGFDSSLNSLTYAYDWSVSHNVPVYQSYSESGDYYFPDIQVSASSSNVNYDDDRYVYEADANDVNLSGSAQRTTSLPADENGNKIISLTVRFEVRGESVSGSTITINQSLRILEIDDESAGDGGYQCTCPDFSLKEDAFNPPAFPSTSQARNWQGTQAGCPTWSDGKRRCGHIVAVQDVRGEDIPVPQDIPRGEA